MKIIRNISMQGLSLPFGTSEGPKSIFLPPRQQVEIPNDWVCRVVENLVHRRMVKLTITEDAAAPIQEITKPVKRIKKSS